MSLILNLLEINGRGTAESTEGEENTVEKKDTDRTQSCSANWTTV